MTIATGPEADRDGSARAGDWRVEISESRRRPIRIWLWSIALTTLAVLIVGGITRLTLSGLSIVDWDPIMGVVPPIGEAAWQEAFERYQQTPDFSWRESMTLEEFRFIHFWEYLHRLLARAINCTNRGDSAEPCNECPSCRQNIAGSSIRPGFRSAITSATAKRPATPSR